MRQTSEQLVRLVWDMHELNPEWGRRHIALVSGALGTFLAASTVRNILLRPKPRPEGTPVAAAGKAEEKQPRQVVARYPNHVWSVDRTRVWRWRIWPTWVLVAIDHFSRKVVACCPLEGPNSGWVVEALEQAFLRHGAPKHLISDQESIFITDALQELLIPWDVKHRLGAVGKHGSIAVTERLIWTLKHAWLARVVLIRGLDHLGDLLADFEQYYNEHRCHQHLGGATPAMVYQGQTWQKPDRSAKQMPGQIRLRHFREQRITVYELAA